MRLTFRPPWHASALRSRITFHDPRAGRGIRAPGGAGDAISAPAGTDKGPDSAPTKSHRPSETNCVPSIYPYRATTLLFALRAPQSLGRNWNRLIGNFRDAVHAVMIVNAASDARCAARGGGETAGRRSSSARGSG